MSEFLVYFQLGIEHILDLNGYDHLLFLVALCTPFMSKDFKHIVWLATAFTIGHCITLLVATYDLFLINSQIIEFLIPVTIVLTTIENLVFSRRKYRENRNIQFRFFIVFAFGLIHGLGFSNYLSQILGKEENIFAPLLGFNLGIEAAQIIIILVFLIFAELITNILSIKRKEWTIGISSAVFALASILIFSAKFW